jgi:hypothetical protein
MHFRFLTWPRGNISEGFPLGDIKVDDMTGEYSERSRQVVEILLVACTCHLERLHVSVL